MSTTEELAALTKQETIGGIKVQRVSDRPPWINMLIYGESGVGKTVLCGSADAVDELRPVLVLDIEGGTLSLEGSYPEVDVVRVRTWDDVQKIYDELWRGKTVYKTVVVDSLSETQKFSMYNIMAALVKKDSSRDPDVAGMHEWNKNTEQIRKFVRAFRDLPVNCLFTAHVQQVKDAKTGLTHNRPSLSGKLAMEVAGFVDIVLFYYKKTANNELQRLLLSQATDTTIAKDRTWKLPQLTEAPDMQALYNYIRGEQK